MTRKQFLLTLVKVTFLALLVYFCLQFFIPRWQALQLSDRLGTLSGLWIVAAAIFAAAFYILGLLIWIMILRNLGSQPSLHMTARAYVLSLLAKYIPGNVAAHGVRTQLAMSAGVPVLILMQSFLLEAIFAIGTAAVISIPGTMYFFPNVADRFFTWVIALIALVLVGIAAARRSRLATVKGFRLSGPGGWTDYLKIGVLYFLVWLASGAAHWCLANAINVHSIARLPHLIVAVPVSWVLGFVSIFAPAGLGVREAVLYFFVNNWMDQADVILFVTLSRLLMFSVEVFLTAGFLLYNKVVGRVETAPAP